MAQESIHTDLQKPTYKYPLANPKLGQLERDFLIDAFDSGWISSSGEYIDRFQNEFAKYIGVRNGVATSNGTTAIHLALAAAGIRAGDEVIVPDLTFIAPANMVAETGAKPIFADSNPSYWGVDANTIRSRITERTKAVIVVHLYGHPVDIDPILEICESKALFLIEDCAEAHGATYKHRKTGSFGNISCFSFYGNKLLTTGEGGMCLTNDPLLEQKMKLLRDHGVDRKNHFWHPVRGFNYRMTNLQAAVGCAQLESLDKRIENYRNVAAHYTSTLKETFREKVTPHPNMEWAECVFWMYSMLLDKNYRKKKEGLRDYLARNGVETRPLFYPISKLPPYLESYTENPVANSLSERGMSLPTYSGLNMSDIEFICNTILAFFKET